MKDRIVKVENKVDYINVILTKEMNKEDMKRRKARGSITIDTYTPGEAREVHRQLGVLLGL